MIQITAIAIACVASASAAEVELIEQSRVVNSSVIVPACFGDDFQIAEAPDFDLFRATAIATIGCDSAFGLAIASQVSEISPSLLTATGSASSQAIGPVSSVIHAISTSGYTVSFEVATPTRYALDATLTAETLEDPIIISAGSVVHLTETGIADVFEHFVQPPPEGGAVSEDIVEIGIIAPGVYDLQVSANSIIDNQIPPDMIGSSTYDFSFRLTTPGDVDDDGQVDVEDLLAVLAAWGPCPACDEDVNGDGVVDVVDLLHVLAKRG